MESRGNNKARLEKTNATSVVRFSDLLEMVAGVHPNLRVRFSTSHPKDITDDVLYAMARHENICKAIHLPAQSGNSRILEMMNRGYTREWYLEKVDRIREILGERCGLSTDMITGFCSETEAEHQETLSLMEAVKFDFAYMFTYSERPGTLAEKKYSDDIGSDIKQRRLEEIISLQTRHSFERNQPDVGLIYQVLVEGPSKRTPDDHQGRNTANKVVVFPKEQSQPGDYVMVKIEAARGGTLIGKIIDGHDRR